MPLDGEGDQTILFEICPEINKTVSKKIVYKVVKELDITETKSRRIPGTSETL